jgi:hypothetical protein
MVAIPLLLFAAGGKYVGLKRLWRLEGGGHRLESISIGFEEKCQVKTTR